MKRLVSIMLGIIILLLSGCSNTIADEQQKADVVQDVLNLHESVYFYCDPEMGNGCEENQELTINDFIHYYDNGTEERPRFHEDWWDLDYDTVVAKYTSDGIYIYLEATGDNDYEFSGLVDRMDISKDDVVKDED